VPARVDTPLIEGIEFAERVAQSMILTGMTRSRGNRAIERASMMLAVLRMSSMWSEHRFNTYYRDKSIERKR